MKEYLKEFHISISLEHFLLRAGIVILILIIFSFYRHQLKDKNTSKSIWNKKLINELLYPIGILTILLIFENFFLNKKEFYFSLKSPINWKLIIDIISELFFELLPIYLTFIVFYYLTIKHEWTKEKLTSNESWDNFSKLLNKNNQKEILALNINDFRLFFHPLGLRYFLEIVKSTKGINEKAVQKRIIVLNSDSYTSMCNLRLINDSLKNNDRLNDDERVFYNIYILHCVNDIELFLVPSQEIQEIISLPENKAIIKNANKKLYEHKFSLSFEWNFKRIDKIILYFFKVNLPIYFNRDFYKTLDSLLINGDCIYPTESNNKIILHERNSNYKSIIESIFNKFTVAAGTEAHSKYHIEAIKAFITKK